MERKIKVKMISCETTIQQDDTRRRKHEETIIL